ncbi:MAG: methyltransferase RsmF C-terminal domain-like protein [Candidatus Hydrothermia bacterium]|jgi:16S rRNA (cytosine1407-C5)-methyltransferase
MSKKIELAVEFLKNRFGIENLDENFALIDRGDIWITSKEALKIKENLKFNRIGIRLIRVFKNNFKLTTSGSQIVGYLAKKNVLVLEDEKLALSYIKGDDIYGNFENLQRGQVIIKFKNDILGVGLYDGEKIKNQIPIPKRISN